MSRPDENPRLRLQPFARPPVFYGMRGRDEYDLCDELRDR
jgi:hypothetical protein